MLQKILFVGGGSVGHIAPAVAVWRSLKDRVPTVECMFVCANRTDDTAYLTAQNLPYSTIVSARLGWNFPWQFCRALWQSFRIISVQKPDIVFSKGSYISVPLCLTAWVLGIPIITHESDTVVGNANTFIGLLATTVCHGFVPKKASSSHVYTGNPSSVLVQQGRKERGHAYTGIPTDAPVLLVLGGSQGASAINDAIVSLLPTIISQFAVVHITGRNKAIDPSLVSQYGALYFQCEFAEHPLPDLYAMAQVAVSRAGSGAITELAIFSIPSVLVPLRSVGHDHQQQNALAASANGGFICMQQTDLQTQLIPWLHSMIDPTSETFRAASAAVSTYAVPDAADRIVEQILQKEHVQFVEK